ncbi:hypothetical protein H310_05687 [Aphanomyces invadans]|uniref:Uncharacterized protein n=1 Tax=Aphanomyces invadans TaxID=157072 RepID=A0A024U782_9STRA|nr:hypothetical protein H310_05687 [Aphanomyces invadans]ETW02080.1 hypothetical protein H310_05687 [Aphanomyces invadans]|eukprot:XP_008868685.1 hypothetical protein H310_05687 [Aphanomyces invadans]
MSSFPAATASWNRCRVGQLRSQGCRRHRRRGLRFPPEVLEPQGGPSSRWHYLGPKDRAVPEMTWTSSACWASPCRHDCPTSHLQMNSLPSHSSRLWTQLTPRPRCWSIEPFPSPQHRSMPGYGAVLVGSRCCHVVAAVSSWLHRRCRGHSIRLEPLFARLCPSHPLTCP